METAQIVKEWIVANWWLILIGCYTGINIANAITAHYSEKKGLVRFVGFIVELLSMVTSWGSRIGIGPMSKIKLPGQTVPPTNGASKTIETATGMF